MTFAGRLLYTITVSTAEGTFSHYARKIRTYEREAFPLATSALTSNTPALGTDASAQNAAFWRVALLMAGTVAVLTLVGTFSAEKLAFFYKEQLHLSASAVASLGILLASPTYFRPFIGAGSDLFPLLGYHRRSYYALAVLLDAGGFFALSLFSHPSYWTTALLVIVTIAGGVTLMIMADAVMVAVGNQTGTVPRLQSIQQLVPVVLSFVALARLSGYVTQHWSYALCFRTAALMALLALPLTLLIAEKRVSPRQQARETSEEHAQRAEAKMRDHAESLAALRQAAKSPGLWAVIAYVFYFTLTPSGSTAQFYFEVDTLHFSKQFIGNLDQWSSAGVILGIVTIAAISRRISVRTLVWSGWAIGTLAYLLNFALRDELSAKIIFFVTSYFGIMASLSLLTLSARACPPKVEGTIYGLFVAAIGLAGTLSNKIGGMLYDYYGVPHHSAVHGWYALSWWGFGLTALAAGLIPLMPAWARSTQPLSAKPEVVG